MGEPTYGFVHGFHTWFWARWFSVHDLDASACIYMYCNIERNIMKNQAGSPDLGSKGKSLCICVLCVMLLHCLFSVF